MFVFETKWYPGPSFIVSKVLQCSLIRITLLLTVGSNCSVILNISRKDIKNQIVSFVLIKNLCIVDLLAALLILPAPLAAHIKVGNGWGWHMTQGSPLMDSWICHWDSLPQFCPHFVGLWWDLNQIKLFDIGFWPNYLSSSPILWDSGNQVNIIFHLFYFQANGTSVANFLIWIAS